MSTMFDNNSGSAGKRNARIEKEQLERRKTKKKATIVVIIFALVVAVSVFANSNFVRRTFPAINIEGVNFSATEFEFFHTLAVNDYLGTIQNEWGDLAEMILPNRDLPFADQIHPLTEETWADTFYNLTIELMTETTLLNLAADEAGFVMPNETREMMELEIEQMRMWAPFMGFPNFNSFIRFTYSMSINERMFIQSMEFLTRAQSFAGYTFDSYTFTQAELDAEYNANRDELDLFIFRVFTVRPEMPAVGDFDSAEEFLQAQENAQDVARERIEQIISRINTEDDFIAEAREYDEEEFYEANSTLAQALGIGLSPDFLEWLSAPERVYGDMTNIEITIPDGVGGETFVSNILFFLERNDNSYRMVDVREIFISRDAFMEGIDDFDLILDEFFTDLVEAMLEEKAQEIFDMFIAAGATEAAFIELVEEHSDGFTGDGGLHTQVARTNVGAGETTTVDEVALWLFEEGRQIGDFEIIRSTEEGFHIVYVVGFGDRYRDLVAEARLRSDTFEEWRSGFTTENISKRWAFFFVSV